MVRLNYISIIVSLGSLVAAWVATVIAIRNHGIAKESFRLVEEQAKGRSPLMIPYLINSEFMIIEAKRLYIFSISITNRSDTDNSITSIQMQINYHRPDQPVASILLNHNSLLADKTSCIRSPLTVPSIIISHNTISGSILFECDAETFDRIVVDSCELIITDSNGLINKLTPILISELVI